MLHHKPAEDSGCSFVNICLKEKDCTSFNEKYNAWCVYLRCYVNMFVVIDVAYSRPMPYNF